MGVEGLAIGVALGSLAHLAIQLPQLRRVGAAVRPVHRPQSAGRAQSGLADGSADAWAGGRTGELHRLAPSWRRGLVAGSVTAYNYAFQLSQLPVGVLGVSVAVALFPTLSRDAALGRVAEIRRQVAASLRVLDLRRRAADGGDDRAGAGRSPRSSSSTASSARSRRRADGGRARLLLHRPGRAHRGARADARLLRHAGHAHAGAVGDHRGRHQRAADGAGWSGRWASRAWRWPSRSAPSLEVIGLVWRPAPADRVGGGGDDPAIRWRRSAVAAIAAALLMFGGLTLVREWLPAAAGRRRDAPAGGGRAHRGWGRDLSAGRLRSPRAGARR